MSSTPDPTLPAADARLLVAHDLALAALSEITPAETIGAPAGHFVEADGVVSLLFENRLHGYPGWFWTVSLARVDDADPTVLEVELLPGDGALLAPEWVPWAVRLAEYQAAQRALAETAEQAGVELDEESAGSDAELDDELDDVDDLDAADFDDDGSPILHAGDLDGVDIDELDPSAPPDDEPDEDDREEDPGDVDGDGDSDDGDDSDADPADDDSEYEPADEDDA